MASLQDRVSDDCTSPVASQDEFLEHDRTNALFRLMSAAESVQANPRPSSPIRALLRPVQAQLVVATALAAIGAMLTLVPLAGIAHIGRIALSDTGVVHAQSEIWTTVVLCVGCVLAGMALSAGGELTAHLADNRLTHRLRLSAAQRLSRVPLGWFTERASGEVKQALQDDIATLHSLIAHFYTAAGRCAGAILISVIYLFAQDWRMASIALLPCLGFFAFLRHAMKASGASMPLFAERLARINSATVEFINGIPVVKAFGDSGRTSRGYREAVDGFAEAFRQFTRPLVASMANAHALIAPITMLGIVLASGAVFVGAGWLTALEIVPFVLVAPGICAPLLMLHTLLHDLAGATSAAQRVQTLLETPLLEAPTTEAQQTLIGHEVRFHNVSYAYGGGPQTLRDLTFTLTPGTVTAIVGASGAGKSTLARLLLRFFDPSSGHITLGGVDLRHIATSQLYKQVGFVLQDVRLIRASVRDNIALGRPSASQLEIENAARVANIHERIHALPHGYDTVLGDDADLSGGERQRVCIARAVLLDPPILVLDEATSAADAESEAAIQDALSRFARGRTLLVISHRLESLIRADSILVLEDGVIAERGTHERLLMANGPYANLWRHTACVDAGQSPAASKELPC